MLSLLVFFTVLALGDVAPLLRHEPEKTINRVSYGVAQRQMIIVFNNMAPQFGDSETLVNWAAIHGIKPEDVKHYYSIGKEFQGFSAWLSASSLDAMISQSIVQFVEEDQVVSLDFTREPLLKAITQVPNNPLWQARPDWGQERINTRTWQLDTNPAKLYSSAPPATYAPPYQPVSNWTWASRDDRRLPSHGEKSVVWILDTGVKANHVEFETVGADGPVSRVDHAVSFVDNEPNVDDLNGHGTHCAGTAAGNYRGIAKEAVIRSVKVLGAGGGGTWAGVIAGVNHISNNQVEVDGWSNILSASLGGGATESVDLAFNAAVRNGVIAVVAAGNGNNNACAINGNSPARAAEVITVVASDSADNVASFSSYGPCCDSIAPGVTVTSAWITPNGQTGTNWYNDISGTSMATPHVAGAVAVFTTHSGLTTPQDTKNALRSDQTPGIITGLTGLKATTPNEFIYSQWTKAP